jgi:hypothetical protein
MEKPTLRQLSQQRQETTPAGYSLAVFGRGAVVRNQHLFVEAQEIITQGATKEDIAAMLRAQVSDSDLHPTRLIEKTIYRNDPNQGSFGPETHPMIDNLEFDEPDHPDARYAGAHANALAAAYLTRQMIQAGSPPQLVQFAAGCTKPLSDYTSHPEGFALMQTYIRQIGAWELRDRRKQGQDIPIDPRLAPQVGLEILQQNGIQLHLQPNNRNSWDDGAHSALGALAENCEKLIVLTVGIHTPRTAAMMDNISSQLDQLGSPLPIEVKASDEILVQAEQQSGHPGHFQHLFRSLEGTTAHLITSARELRGLQAAVSKRYQAHQGTSNQDIEAFWQTQYQPQVITHS